MSLTVVWCLHAIGVILVSVILTSNRLHFLFLCFDCWLWTGKYPLDYTKYINRNNFWFQLNSWRVPELEYKLLHRYFLLCDWCYWSAGLFAILWFAVFQNNLLAPSAISLELFQKLWKACGSVYDTVS